MKHDTAVYPSRVKALLAVVVLTLFGLLVLYILGFHIPPTATTKPLLTGGRGNLFLLGLTASRLSIGTFAPILFVVAIVLFNVSWFAFRDLFLWRK